ncbi:MAG: Teichoic acid export ATP-binding protein TagH [Verrucomicrobiota bacterium]|jgi:lipopolysaccharide transport system ATP-binding protein
MSLPAIEVSGLSKRYVIERESRHDSLRDTLHHSARKLWRRLRWGTGFEREEFWALRDVSFSIQPGEVVGIIGRNGAGKSTLLKILSRITEPTAGQITLRGRVASLLEVGTGFHPDLTGRENIYLNGAILGMQRAEISRKFDEIVAFAEVERFLDTPVKRYSSGMYVRLAFAVAAHLEPEILIVDEVLAVGDAQFQKKCLGKMQDVARNQGRTVLFVSHNLAAVNRLCTSAINLEQGRLVFRGPVPEAISRYLGQTQLTGPLINFSRRTQRSTQLEITGGTLLQDGQPSPCLDYDGTLTLRLELKVSEPVSGNVELVLRDSQQGALAFFPAAVVEDRQWHLLPGTHTLEVCIPALPLASGSYTLDVMITDHMKQFYDALEAAFTLELNPNALGIAGWHFTQERGQGSILLQGTTRLLA